MHTFSKYHQTLHRAWLKGFRDGEFIIQAKTLADAHAIRFGLYNSVKPIRDKKAFIADVGEAVGNCTIKIDEEALTVTITNRMQDGAMLSLLEALGEEGTVCLEPQVTDFDQELIDSQARLLEKLSAPEEVRKNPFYTREER